MTMSQHVAGAGSRSLLFETGGQASGWRRRIALAIVATVLAFAGHSVVASAATQVAAPDAGEQAFLQNWIDHSLMPSPDVSVNVTGTICPGGQYMACSTYSPVRSTIAYPDIRYIFQAPYTSDTVDQTRAQLEFLHELGHIFDWANSTRGAGPSPLRSDFLRIMHITGSGVSDTQWAGGRIGSLSIDPQEQFAMAYNYCALYQTLPSAVIKTVFWGFGYNPTPRQYTQTCSLIERAGSGQLATQAAAARAHTASIARATAARKHA
jgi:hypothetical protein